MESPRSMAVTRLSVFAILLLVLVHGVSSFYLPGVAPEDFKQVSSRFNLVFLWYMFDLDFSLSDLSWIGSSVSFLCLDAAKIGEGVLEC